MVVGGEVFAEHFYTPAGPVVAFVDYLHVAAEAFPDEGGADDDAVAGEKVVPTFDVGVLGLAAGVQAPAGEAGAELGAVFERDRGRVTAEAEDGGFAFRAGVEDEGVATQGRDIDRDAAAGEGALLDGPEGELVGVDRAHAGDAALLVAAGEVVDFAGGAGDETTNLQVGKGPPDGDRVMNRQAHEVRWLLGGCVDCFGGLRRAFDQGDFLRSEAVELIDQCVDLAVGRDNLLRQGVFFVRGLRGGLGAVKGNQ